MSSKRTRRQFLTATAATLGGLGLASTTNADDHRSFVVEQDGECYPVVPLSGADTVEEFYEWGLPERSYSSEGTRELQEPEASLLFLYRGPEGLSLVIVHDALDDGTPGGKVSFELQGVPADATWAVKDDLYDASTNVDTWELNGTVLEANESTITDGYNGSEENDSEPDENETADGRRTDEIDWWWTTGRTDGGALRGLAVDDLELRVEPAFNGDAELADKPNEGEITSWELLSGDREDPDRTALDLEAPLTLRTGGCGGNGATPTDATATDENSTPTDAGTTEEEPENNGDEAPDDSDEDEQSTGDQE